MAWATVEKVGGFSCPHDVVCPLTCTRGCLYVDKSNMCFRYCVHLHTFSFVHER